MKTSLEALKAAKEHINELNARIHSQRYDWNADRDEMTLKSGRALELIAGAIKVEESSTIITIGGGPIQGDYTLSPGTAS